MKIHTVCSFTDRPFTGNPAAVCLLDKKFSVEWMKKIAAEMRLSETAFVSNVSLNRFAIRWFTANGFEVELCGHATLAAAHVLYQTGKVESALPIEFQSKSGPLRVSKSASNEITLDFPVLPIREDAANPSVIDALGFTPVSIWRGETRYLIELSSEREVREFKPNLARIAALDLRGFCVTAQSDGGPYDFISRYFAPRAGMDEDPVTGSVHCMLAPYWEKKLGKKEFLAYQASARGGELKVSFQGDRVLISGKAITEFEMEVSQSLLGESV